MVEAAQVLGLGPDELREVLAAATLAPSVHNTQPWRFRLADDRIELHADPARRLPATDPEDRELRLACGAALFNLRLALRARLIRPLVTLLPGSDAPGALAVVRRGGRQDLDEEARGLIGAVPARRSNRMPFRNVPVPAAHAHALVRAAERERTWLHVVADREERARLQRMVGDAHRVQAEDPAVRSELAAWTGVRAGDGVPPASAGIRPAPQDEWALRDFDARERTPGKDYESDPLMVVLCSFHDGPQAELQAGQALQRVLLTATTFGLSASFLSQPVEVRSVRERLRRSLGGSLEPQAVLRIGFGSPVPPTPRREVEALVLEQGLSSRC
ncbi:nitroreductase family protein [Actinosynnema sp. NPDC047251]|uniref:Nitroreductase n=1 Tax=Saccharothrix espanaensis (strain ATCC 51144 / DSM 44229 / JCM 9112 / NBRC 15066 / NRRL 15764) TaxID=1179773 RepID=K0K889_SACES|nr:nitroreductase family protein [Saccharothrix espanaensis]CCH32893.1 Nitroreductase [Saccharothrix espanaensis DSM 44229]